MIRGFGNSDILLEQGIGLPTQAGSKAVAPALKYRSYGLMTKAIFRVIWKTPPSRSRPRILMIYPLEASRQSLRSRPFQRTVLAPACPPG